MATRRKKQEAAEKGIRQQMEFLYGKENAEHPLYQTAFHVISAFAGWRSSTTDEVVSMMEYYLEHGDPDIGYLYLSFF